jgi:hypothetical protein
MPGITSYPIAPPRGFAGQLADLGYHYIRSAINREVVPIPFGLAMKKGTLQDEALVMAATGDKILGIGVHRQDVNVIGQTAWPSTAGIPVGDRFDILKVGIIYVLAEEAVTEFDKAFARFQGGTGSGQHGGWRKSADANVAWAISTTYAVGNRRTNDTAKLYEVVSQTGPSAGSGGPTGVGSAIVDGGVVWKYLETVSGATAVSAVAVNGAYFLETAAAGVVVPMYFNFSTAAG